MNAAKIKRRGWRRLWWRWVRYAWAMFQVLSALAFIVGTPIYLIVQAIQAPQTALKVLILGVATGIGLVPIYFLFRNSADTIWGGCLLVSALIVLTVCLMPLTLELFPTNVRN